MKFSEYSDIGFVIMPGKNDHYSSESIYKTNDFGENVFVFDSENIKRFEFVSKDGTKANVYGAAYTSQVFFAGNFSGYTCEDPEAVNILMWGGDPALKEADADIQDLIAFGADYTALGQCSVAPGIYDEEKMWYAYPGSPEPSSYDSIARNGFIYFEGEKNDGDLICRHRFIDSGERTYFDSVVNAAGSCSSEDVYEKVKAKLESIGGETLEQNLLRITLRGDVSPETVIPRKRIYELACTYGMFDFELEDETIPLYNCDYLSSDPTIKGAFFRSCRAGLCSDDKNQRENAVRSFRAGLAALGGTNIGVCKDE